MVQHTFIVTQSNRQWFLELMGLIRSTSRRFGPDSPQFAATFDVLAFCAVLFSESECFCHPRARLCSSPTERRSLFALSVSRLLRHPSSREWRSAGPQLCEWMLHIARDARTPDDLRSLLVGTFPAFKDADAFYEASMWSRLIPM